VEAYGEVLQPEDSGYGDAASQRGTASLESLVVPYERGLADDVEAYLEVMSDAGAAEGFSRDGSRDNVVPVWVSAPWSHWKTDGLRQAVALSLGRIGDSRAVESLARCADDEDEPLMLRAYAIDALGVIGDDRGFDVVAISADEDRELLQAFVQQRELPWTVLFDADPETESMATYYGVSSFPTIFLVNADGKVVSLEARGPALGYHLNELLGPPEEAEGADAESPPDGPA
jgi:hypothetical protein